jgi:hypothetical protein
MSDNDIWRLPGIGGELQDLYMQTAQIPDIRFAWVAVTSIFSVVGSRVYSTPSGNFTSQYFMVLARSSSGKNHIISFIQEVLWQSGLRRLILTPELPASRPGLISTLKHCPSQIFIRDEAGHLREAGKTSAHDVGVMAALMSVSGGTGYLAAASTTERGLKGAELEKKRDFERPIPKPGITLLEISTPDRLTKQLTPADIDSGELGRFVIITDPGELPDMVEYDPPAIHVPEHIREYLYNLRYDPRNALDEEQAWTVASDEIWQDWDNSDPVARELTRPTEDMIASRLAVLKNEGLMQNNPDNPHRPPVPTVMCWEDANLRSEVFLNMRKRLLTKYYNNGTALHSKQHEHAMRLSQIYSLMDEQTKDDRTITREYADRVIGLTHHMIAETDRLVVPNIAENDYQRAINFAVGAIKAGNGETVKVDAWVNRQPWKRLNTTERLSLLDALETDYPEIRRIDLYENATAEQKRYIRKFNRSGFVWIGGAT